jgi:hypothetical protein
MKHVVAVAVETFVNLIRPVFRRKQNTFITVSAFAFAAQCPTGVMI